MVTSLNEPVPFRIPLYNRPRVTIRAMTLPRGEPVVHPSGIPTMVSPVLRAIQVLQEHAIHLHFSQVVSTPDRIARHLPGQYPVAAGTLETQDTGPGRTACRNDAHKAAALAPDVGVAANASRGGKRRADPHQQANVRPRRPGASTRPLYHPAIAQRQMHDNGIVSHRINTWACQIGPDQSIHRPLDHWLATGRQEQCSQHQQAVPTAPPCIVPSGPQVCLKHPASIFHAVPWPVRSRKNSPAAGRSSLHRPTPRASRNAGSSAPTSH